jgi:dTDP-4-amino-4,6-dideoxygalactose transaminase
MKILFNRLEQKYIKNKNRFLKIADEVLSSGRYILGPFVNEFEKKFADYIGAKYCVGVGNGLEALQIGLIALGIGKGDEVITTSLSAVASSLAIKAVGAKPVFIDIDEYYHLDADQIEKYINKKTKAILLVHLYGQSVDLDKILKIGTFGDVGCFSFYPTKNLGAFGDGGCIVTNDRKIADLAKMIRNYGQKNRYEHIVYGINSRLDELQAAFLLEKLRYLDEDNLKRQKKARIYFELLKDVKQIKLPLIRSDSNHIFHLFVVEVEEREKLQKFLKEKAIETLIHYPIPIHKQKCFKEYNNIRLPIVEEKTKKILSLPLYPDIKDEEIIYICKSILKFYENK